MIKTNIHIEIVTSSVSNLSSMGRKSRDAIFDVLAAQYTHVNVTIVNNLADLEALVIRKPDLVFLGMKFVRSDPTLGLHDPKLVWVSQFLGEHGIAHTGSDFNAHELERNKPLAKQRVLNAGLKTSRYSVAIQNERTKDMDFLYPLFVKPTDRGGGQGIDSDSVVHNFAQLTSKITSITTTLQSDSLIEQYLPGREFSVAILRDEETSKYQAMPIELVAPSNARGNCMLSNVVKSSNTEVVLKVTDQPLRHKVCKLALDVFKALGAQDYGRIDIRLDEFGTPHFLEANLLPSLISGYGSFPKACKLNQGLDYRQMILTIVRLTLARTNIHENMSEPYSSGMLPSLLGANTLEISTAQ